MPLDQLEPVVALVIIDLQQGIVGAPAAHPIAEIVQRAARLAQAFRRCRLPVVLVNVAGSAPGRTDVGRRNYNLSPDWIELVPELSPQPGDHIVTKNSWGAFYGTSLHEYLRSKGVTQIVLAGVSTSIGVESTARAAYDAGYHVVLVVDAMTDLIPESHRHSIEKIFPRLGQVTTTEELLKLVTTVPALPAKG